MLIVYVVLAAGHLSLWDILLFASVAALIGLSAANLCLHLWKGGSSS